jgi:hypothetical protein
MIDPSLPADLKARIEQVLAQLRHAYQQLVRHDERWSRRGMQDFADGLIAPQIRKLEALLASLVETEKDQEKMRPSGALKPDEGRDSRPLVPIDQGV